MSNGGFGGIHDKLLLALKQGRCQLNKPLLYNAKAV